MYSISTHIKKGYVRKDGTSSVFLQVILQGEVLKIYLDAHWYPNYWKDGRAQERTKDDKSARDLNLIIQDVEAKANEIFIQYRLRRKGLTKALFEKEWNTSAPSHNFLTYMERKLEQRLREREIGLSSYKTQLVALHHLKAWKKSIPFETLNERFAFQLDDYLVRRTGSQMLNARAGIHKSVKTYLNQAKSERIEFTHPYDYFSPKTQMGRFQPLHKSEVIALWNLYLKGTLPHSYQDALRAFLFVCLTGMRHSDVRRFRVDWIQGDFIEWVAHKTRRFGTLVKVPTNNYILRLIMDEMEYRDPQKLFQGVTEQKQNEYVRAIGEDLRLSTRVCFQVGRETFATLYIEHDGKLDVLASMLGHTTTKMSEKYVKIRDQRKKEEAHRIASFFEEKI